MDYKRVTRFYIYCCLVGILGLLSFSGVANAAVYSPLQVPCAGCYSAGQTLSLGQSWTSQNGNYSLNFQDNGDLVETYNPTGQVVYDADTSGLGGVTVYSPSSLLPDAQINYLTLDIVNSSGQIVWYTPVQSNPNDQKGYLQIQNNGELDIYRLSSIWSSGTGSMLVNSNDLPSVFIPEGTVVDRGATFSTNNGACVLNFQQSDGNLVLYSAGAPQWATYTENEGASYFKFQYDANFVVYNSAGAELWNSGTENEGASGSYLVMQPECNLVIYSPSKAYAFGT